MLQGLRYWVRTPTHAEPEAEPKLSSTLKPKKSGLQQLRSFTSELGTEAREAASMAAAVLSGIHPVPPTNSPLPHSYTPGHPPSAFQSRHASPMRPERHAQPNGAEEDHPPASPWEAEAPLHSKAAGLNPWDSASSLPAGGLEAARHTSSPLFFMHGVGLGIVRPALTTSVFAQGCQLALWGWLWCATWLAADMLSCVDC